MKILTVGGVSRPAAAVLRGSGRDSGHGHGDDDGDYDGDFVEIATSKPPSSIVSSTMDIGIPHTTTHTNYKHENKMKRVKESIQIYLNNCVTRAPLLYFIRS